MLTGKDILDLPMRPSNDAKAKTVRGYLKTLLVAVWTDGEGFSGKRPFGNSGWQYDLFAPLVMAGAVKGVIDEYGACDLLPGGEEDKAMRLILLAINALN